MWNKLDARETATVLAALRYWQRNALSGRCIEDEIATDCGMLPALDFKEIDALCERINCGEFHSNKLLKIANELVKTQDAGRGSLRNEIYFALKEAIAEAQQ